MGIFNKIFGGADGIRETVRETYLAQKELGRKQGVKSEDIEYRGLYGALGSRYIARGQSINDVVLMTEVQPFCMMDKKVAIDMLAEYVVLQEMPHKANIFQLARSLNSVIDRTYGDDATKTNLALAFLSGIGWCELLNEVNLNRLHSYMSGSETQKETSPEELVVADKTEPKKSEPIIEKFTILEKVTPKGDGAVNKKACLQCGAESFENDYLKSAIGYGWLRCPVCNMNFQDSV